VLHMYHHLGLEEREKLYCLKEQGISLRLIAKKLDRSPASLSRELRRNQLLRKGLEKFSGIYIPCRAQKKAEKQAMLQRSQASWKGPEVLTYISEKLRLGWSPETIAGRLSIDHPELHICHETIYRMIYEKQNRKFKLWKYLTVKRKKRMKKLGRNVHREGRIPEAISIDLRPMHIQTRGDIGHWETDNVIGKISDDIVLSVSVERKTRLTIMSLVERTADAKAAALFQRFSPLPNVLRKTMTTDNGKENTRHKQITESLGIPVYFCHAYASWEKGTVENMNGRIRRFLPKHQSLTQVTTQTVSQIEWKLNNTPRKCLNWKTPLETLKEFMQNTKTSDCCTSS